MTDRRTPKIGLALGSGGARGFAHIGVLKVLEAHNISVDLVAGSSMGSLIGALYCNGIEPGMMEKLAVNLKRKHWLDPIVPNMGLVAGEKIKQLVRLLTHQKNLEQLTTPLAVVATDIETGEKVVFREGPIDQAVRASISIPGIFVPEKVGDRVLVDGGVVDRVPVSVVREMGADIVIAVDVAQYEIKMKVRSIFDVIAQAIDVMEREILRHQILSADLIIRPQVGQYSSISYTDVEEIVAEGERTALEQIEAIQSLIADWKGER